MIPTEVHLIVSNSGTTPIPHSTKGVSYSWEAPQLQDQLEFFTPATVRNVHAAVDPPCNSMDHFSTSLSSSTVGNIAERCGVVPPDPKVTKQCPPVPITNKNGSSKCATGCYLGRLSLRGLGLARNKRRKETLFAYFLSRRGSPHLSRNSSGLTLIVRNGT